MNIMNSKYPVLFYENIGKLFYAISASDKSINEKEITALHELIESKWDKDLHLVNIEITFHRLKEENASSGKCFRDFVVYKNENNFLFSSQLKRLISCTAGSIASSFSNRNKSELIMLAQLEFELRK